MFRAFSFFFSILFFFSFIGASCTLPLIGQGKGSIYKTENNGASWASRSLVVQGKSRARLSSVDVTTLFIDPFSAQTLFLGTKEHGLFFSDNGAEHWVQLIARQWIVDIARNANSRCSLFVATDKRVYATSDCGTTWSVLFHETREGVRLTALLVDSTASQTIYVTTSAGDVFMSADNGETWKTQYRFPGKDIAELISDTHNPGVLFLATRTGSVYRGTQEAREWVSRMDALPTGSQKREFRFFDTLGQRDGLLLVTDKDMFKSYNGGESWEQVPLLTPQGAAPLFAAAVNHTNHEEIYYATRNTLYFTQNNGRRWMSRPLVFPRPPSVLALDPTDSKTLYLGLAAWHEQSPYWYY